MLDVLATATMIAAVNAADPPPLAAEAIGVEAGIGDAVFEVGGAFAVDLRLTVADGWSMAAAGVPIAFLQLEVPPSVRLVGAPTRQEQRVFLDVPFERALEPGPTTVPFTLTGEPAADDRIALNVVAYVRRGKDGPADFVRRRLELPLRPGATARAGDDRRSTWGPRGATLQIGDRAEAFSLPRADGTRASLADHLGTRNVLLTTYRAFW